MCAHVLPPPPPPPHPCASSKHTSAIRVHAQQTRELERILSSSQQGRPPPPPHSHLLPSFTLLNFTPSSTPTPLSFMSDSFPPGVAALGGQWGALSDMRKTSARGLLPFTQLTNKTKVDPKVKLCLRRTQL